MEDKSLLERRKDAAAQALLARTHHWTKLSDEDLETSVRAALNEGRYEILWGAMESYLTLYGPAGSRISSRTLENHRYGFFKFLRFAKKQQIEILSPQRDLGQIYKFYLMSDESDRIVGRKPFDPLTVILLITTARHFYRFLKWSLSISPNPFDGVYIQKPFVDAWEKRQPYSETEIKELSKGATERQHLAVLLGAHAGLRISEILNVQVKDFNIQCATLHVTRGKGGSPRTVNLSPALVKSATCFMSESGYIFEEDYQTLRKQLITLAHDCKVVYKGFHSLRHYCGTSLYLRTRNIEMVSQHLGHKSLEVTRTYVKPNNDAIRRELAKW